MTQGYEDNNIWEYRVKVLPWQPWNISKTTKSKADFSATSERLWGLKWKAPNVTNLRA